MAVNSQQIGAVSLRRTKGDEPELMITRFLSWPVRRYAYAVGEIVSIAVFAFTFSVLFADRGYQVGLHDPGMAKPTAGCFMALSAAAFLLSTCLKKIDVEK